MTLADSFLPILIENSLHASVIICTRNRASSLRQTLESFSKLIIPPDFSAELLVVDNGSTDDTASVVKRALLPNLSLRYAFEPRKGQCFARNRGLAETTGQVIIFTDDDVRVPPNWLEAMCRPILEGKADGTQGGIHPAPHLLRPWLNGFLSQWIAATNAQALEGDSAEELIGANMAFARTVLKRVSGFDIELGPGALGFGDDTLFSKQMIAAGYHLLPCRDAAVEHHFESNRLTEKAFISHGQSRGKTAAFLAHHWEHRRLRLARTRLAILRFKLFLRLLFTRKPSGTQSPRLWLICYHKDIAFWKQYLKEIRRPPKYPATDRIPPSPETSPTLATGRASCP